MGSIQTQQDTSRNQLNPENKEVENDRKEENKTETAAIGAIVVTQTKETELSAQQKEQLESIKAKENTNFQWTKLAMNYGILIVMTVIKLIRGPGAGQESLLGITICSWQSWLAFAIQIIIVLIFSGLAAKIANNEYEKKEKLGYEFSKGDQKFSNRVILKLILIAFIVAFFSGIAGLGPGLIFNSVLVQLDMHPAVASATGMYCTLFTTAAATINVLINQKLDLPFAGWICSMTLIGTLPGLYG